MSRRRGARLSASWIPANRTKRAAGRSSSPTCGWPVRTGAAVHAVPRADFDALAVARRAEAGPTLANLPPPAPSGHRGSGDHRASLGREGRPRRRGHHLRRRVVRRLSRGDALPPPQGRRLRRERRREGPVRRARDAGEARAQRPSRRLDPGPRRPGQGDDRFQPVRGRRRARRNAPEGSSNRLARRAKSGNSPSRSPGTTSDPPCTESRPTRTTSEPPRDESNPPCTESEPTRRQASRRARRASRRARRATRLARRATRRAPRASRRPPRATPELRATRRAARQSLAVDPFGSSWPRLRQAEHVARDADGAARREAVLRAVDRERRTRRHRPSAC